MKGRRRTFFMETTKIETSQTAGEIQKVLGEYGASAIMMEYNNKEISALSFEIIISGQRIPFRLPCKWQAIYQALKVRRKRMLYERSDEAQAKRIAWRQILRWVEAQLALVETEMVKIQEVFLPYLQIGIDKTLYDELEQTKFKMIEHKRRTKDAKP